MQYYKPIIHEKIIKKYAYTYTYFTIPKAYILSTLEGVSRAYSDIYNFAECDRK